MARTNDLRLWFSLKRLPFSDSLPAKDMFLRPALTEMAERVAFAVSSGYYYTVIGEVGAGKSTALRYVASRLPAQRVQIIDITGGGWSFTEVLRQTMGKLGSATRTGQPTTMLRTIYEGYSSIREGGKEPVVFIDEAHLFHPDVFSQLHLLSQPSLRDGKTVPVVLCGQMLLAERILSQYNKPLASRVVDGTNLRSMGIEETREYIRHHLVTLCGADPGIMDENIMTMVAQGSGGIPRQVNTLCLRAMQDAMEHSQHTIGVDNVRRASAKWWEA